MAYKYAKGKVFRGDIYNEDDTERNTYIDFGTDDYIGLVTSGSAVLVVSGSAVGIGTDAPSHELTVAGDISGSGDLLLGGKISLGNKNVDPPSAMLHISSSYTQTNPLVQIEAGDDGEDGAQLLIKGNMRPNSQATSTLIELNSNLDVRARGIHLTTDDGNEEWFSGVPYPGGRYQIGFDGTNGLPWRVNSSSLDILESGDVGIGTSGNPSAKLHVIDTGEIMRLGYDTSNYTIFNISSNGTLALTTNDSSADLNLYPASILRLGTQYTDNVHVGRTDTTSDTIIYGGTSGAEVMRIDGSADSVGIGTATPNSTFQVSGSQAGNYTSTTASRVLGETEYMVDYTGNGDATITLPAVSGITGRVYHIISHAQGENDVLTVTGSGGQFQGPNLEGDTDSIDIEGWTPQSLTVVSTGGNWFILTDNRVQEHGG